MTVCETSRYAVKSGGMSTASGHSRLAREVGIADPTPNARASYDAVVTTARGPLPDTMTGRPRSSGRRCSSTLA